ncbi:M13-type metalloendopeptidase [Clostridium cagae]|uniref:M13-type metalloendopeptidase n=2 Tax=Clostridiaceae TaxID=31979 RepID=UPI00398D55F4
MNNLEWMSEFTKEKAVRKLNNINVKIGYPDVWTNYTQLIIKRHNNCGCLLQNVLNICNFQLKQELLLLNKEVENLGGVGAVIGHELTHAFDNTCSKFDEYENLNNWWTDEYYEEFNIRSKKVMDYYSHIQINNGEFVNGKLTAGENISDLGGVACIIDIANNINIVLSQFEEFYDIYGIKKRAISICYLKIE